MTGRTRTRLPVLAILVAMGMWGCPSYFLHFRPVPLSGEGAKRATSADDRFTAIAGADGSLTVQIELQQPGVGKLWLEPSDIHVTDDRATPFGLQGFFADGAAGTQVWVFSSDRGSPQFAERYELPMDTHEIRLEFLIGRDSWQRRFSIQLDGLKGEAINLPLSVDLVADCESLKAQTSPVWRLFGAGAYPRCIERLSDES